MRLEGLKSWVPNALGEEFEGCLWLIAFGSCAVALSTETAPWSQENTPCLIRTIGSVFSPVGLIMIVLSGVDLFTSNVVVK